MCALARKTVYEQVVEVTQQYLGPAAERFVNREVEAHLGKKPNQMTRDDVLKLHDWSKLAIALMTEDEKLVDDFSKNLLAISKNRGN